MNYSQFGKGNDWSRRKTFITNGALSNEEEKIIVTDEYKLRLSLHNNVSASHVFCNQYFSCFFLTYTID